MGMGRDYNCHDKLDTKICLDELSESADYGLGRIAYEAYCATTGWKSAITNAALPKFDDCQELVKKGWIAAAKAVQKELDYGQ